jgi:hypothetical protein
MVAVMVAILHADESLSTKFKFKKKCNSSMLGYCHLEGERR